MKPIRLRTVILAHAATLIPFGDRAARRRRYEELEKTYEAEQAVFFEESQRRLSKLMERNKRLQKRAQDALDAIEAKR